MSRRFDNRSRVIINAAPPKRKVPSALTIIAQVREAHEEWAVPLIEQMSQRKLGFIVVTTTGDPWPGSVVERYPVPVVAAVLDQGGQGPDRFKAMTRARLWFRCGYLAINAYPDPDTALALARKHSRVL